MKTIVYFDYCALILITIILISIFVRNMTKGKTNDYFLKTVVIAFLTTIFDIISITLDNSGSGNILWKYVAHSLYLFFHSMTIPFYIAYLVALTDTWHILRTNKLIKYIIPLPYLLICLSLIVNIFTKSLFYMDAADHYTRGILFPIVYVAGFSYAFLGVYYIIRYRRLFRPIRFLALMSIFAGVAFATAFQLFVPNMPVEMFATCLGLLLIAMLIQRPEENVDTTTNLHNMVAYTSDLKRGLSTKKDIDIIMVNIANYRSIRDMLGIEDAEHTLSLIADQMTELNKKNKRHAAIYYLDKGRFRIIADSIYADETAQFAETINKALSHNMTIKHMNVKLIAYVCLVSFPKDIETYELLLSFGERLSKDYEHTGEVLLAKEIFKKETYDLYRHLDGIIEKAIKNRNLHVYYQPIYSVSEQRFHSAEALLRLIDDEYGFVPPDIFIPAAEKSGAIHRIGTYVLDTVCQFIASDEFKALNLDYIEINLSVAQCMHKELSTQVVEMINKYKINPAQVNLEITETAASYSQKTMEENLAHLNNSGFSISLDDYGTGYSNIQRVASLPLAIVKLDKSFVDGEENPRLSIVLQNTIRMLKDMNMEIVAEGIETKHMLDRFSAMGCDYIQGYYFSKPLPKDDFVTFIQNHQ